MTSTASPVTEYFDHLKQADKLTGPDRAVAYDELMKLSAPALQVAAAEEFPQATLLVFEINYTDEGSALYLSGHKTADGTFHERTDCMEADMIDEIIFAITGSGEDGSNVPGMVPTTPHRYELTITSQL